MPEISESEKISIAIQKEIARNKYIGQREIIQKLKKENQWSYTTINSSIKRLREEELILYRPGKKYQYYMPYHQEPVHDDYLVNLISKLRNAIDMIDNDNKNIAESVKREMYFRIKNATRDLNNLVHRSKLEQNEYKESDEEDYLIKEIMKYSKYNIPKIKKHIFKSKKIHKKIRTLRERYTNIVRKSDSETIPEKTNSIACDIRENTNELRDLKEGIVEIKHMCQQLIFSQEINKMQKSTDTHRLLKRLNIAAEKDGMVQAELGRVCEHLKKEIKPVFKNKLVAKVVKTKKFTNNDLDEIISQYEIAGIIHRKGNKIYVLGYI